MNDKIKELAQKAGYVPLPGFDFANSLQEVFMQKFAEVIVRECADVAGKFVQDNKYKEDGISEYHLQDNIKEHFGVDP